MKNIENAKHEEKGFDWMERLKSQIEFSDAKLNLALKHLENSDRRLKKLISILESAGQIEDLASIKREISEAKSEVREVQTLVKGTKRLNTMVKEKQEKSISLMKVFHDKLEEEQKIDELTKLGSKKYFEYMGARLIAEQKEFLLVFIDLNNLKIINDQYGHDSGDSILIDFAKDLSNVLGGANNTAFRIHGDEFLVISNDELEVITMKMNKLTEWLERRRYKIVLGAQAIHIETTFAYGIANREKCDDLITLKTKAERKMYSHKKRMKDDDNYGFTE